MTTDISLQRWLDTLADKAFLESQASSYTYGQAARFIKRVSLQIDSVIPAQQQVVPMMMGNSTEFVLVLLAIMAAGKTPYPIQPNCKPAEFEAKTWGLDVSTVLADAIGAPIARANGKEVVPMWQLLETASRQSDRGAVCLTIPGTATMLCGTSGTTERPKKVELRLSSMLRNAAAHAESIDIDGSDRILSCLPFYHGFTLLTHIFSVLALEATLIAGTDATPKGIAQMALDFKATYTSFVPAILDAVIRHFEPALFEIPSLKRVSVGSAPVTAKQVAAYRAYFGATKLYVTYGQTEAGPRICTLDVNAVREELWDTVGALLRHTEVRLDQQDSFGVGELQVRADWQMERYHGDPEASAQQFTPDGWLKTGDLAQLVDERFIRLCGRKKDLIISGGVNISPAEIEKVLSTIAWVQESMVIAVPDNKRGEVPHAFVVGLEEQGCATTAEREILAVLKSRLGLIKVPKKVHFVQTIPKNAIGKPDRKALLYSFMASAAA